MARATPVATAAVLAVAFVVLPIAKQVAAEDEIDADDLLGRFRTIAQEAIDERGLELSNESRADLDDVLRRGIETIGGEDAKPGDVVRAEENLVALVEAYEVKLRDRELSTSASQAAEGSEVGSAATTAAGNATADEQTASAAAGSNTATESASAAETEEPWCPPPRLYPFCVD